MQQSILGDNLLRKMLVIFVTGASLVAAGCGGSTTTVETVITKQAATTPAETSAETGRVQTAPPVQHTSSGAGEGSHGEHGGTVPNETKVRLDVAEEELESRKLAYKVVGGGLFGVVVKSHWTVCEVKPPPGTHVGSGTTVRLIVARSCE